MVEFATVMTGDVPRQTVSQRNHLAWWVIVFLIAAYSVAFLMFYPKTLTVDDEKIYVNQARTYLQGSTTITQVDPFTGETTQILPSKYPVGTSLLMAPFVWAGGWQAAFVSSWLSLVCLVLLTALWLSQENRSPLFAAVILGFPAALVMGRVAMSDAPSGAVVALGLWLFWRGLNRSWWYWLAAGFVAGTSTLLREPNVIPFVVFFAGTVFRRERKCFALIIGGVAGLGVRVVSGTLAFGEPFFFITPAYGFGLDGVVQNVQLYLVAMLVLVPGGLLAALGYRGQRRPEVILTVLLFIVFYCFYRYGAVESGMVKRFVLSLRFFVPLLPLLAFAMAEAFPRWWHRFAEIPRDSTRRVLAFGARVLVVLWVIGITSATTGVHWAFDHWSRTHVELRQEIQRHIDGAASLIINRAAYKHLDELDGPQVVVQRIDLSGDRFRTLTERYKPSFIVFVDRSDSKHWLGDIEANQEFIDSLARTPQSVFDHQVSPAMRLRIWRVDNPSPVEP